EAPGLLPSQQRFTVERGQKKTVELSLGGAALPVADAPPSAGAAPEAAQPAPRTGQGQRIAAFATGGVGLAMLLVGAVTGGLTLAKKGVIEANCQGTRCNHEGKAAADSAQTLGLVSTIGFVVGGAGLVTGTVLFFTAPKKIDEKAARFDVELGPGGLVLGA